MSIDLKYHVPTVALHTRMFEAVSKSVARMNGAPKMRQVYVPHPVVGKTVVKPINSVYTQDDPATWEEVQAKAHAAIVGVGH